MHFDAEIPVLIHEVFAALPEIPPVTIRVNNRKVVEGVMRGLGVEDVTPVMRALDKLGKRGAERVGEDLRALSAPAEQLIALAEVRGDVTAGVRALGRGARPRGRGAGGAARS